MVPGIDLAGVVTESSHADWSKGDRVVLNGWGVGETHWGGLAQRARLNGDWLVPLPSAFTTRQAMAIGTAGYTASLCVDALAAARGVSGSGRDPGDRRDRRRRQRRDRAVDRGRLQSGCRDREVVGGAVTCSNSAP